MSIHVLGVSGSLRRGSYNTRLLQIAQDRLPDGMELHLADLAPLPFYNADLEPPDSVIALKEQIRQADALLIACPEYNYSVTGVLKNAIDWVSRPPADSPLNGKPLGMMGVGGRFGTVRAQMHLRQIAHCVNMLPLNKPEIYISNFPHPAFDEQGNLVDQFALDLLDNFLPALRDWASLHRK